MSCRIFIFEIIDISALATLISMGTTNNLLDMADMIAELESSGLDTKKKIISGILDRKDESFPFLARLATSQECWYDDSIDRWSPICAIHLLAKMGHYQAQLAVNSAVLEFYDDTGDWLTGDLPYVLAHMGPDAIPTLTGLMRYGDTDMFVRGMAAHALVIIIREHPETKPETVVSIMDAARKDSDIEVRTILVDSLVDLADPDLYEYLRAALRTGFVTDEVFRMYDVDRVNATQRSSRGDPRDPLYIFEPRYKKSFAYLSSSE